MIAEATPRGTTPAEGGLAALAGSSVLLSELPPDEETELARLPAATRRAAEQIRATAVLVLPVEIDGYRVGSMELLRTGSPFKESERALARLGAALAALAV